ncbi:MAG TPA: methyl-accepting chemotaxis protein, partial [Deferrimonas sp.]
IREENQKVQASMKESIGEMDAGREALDSTGQAFEAIIQTALGTQVKATGIAELSQKQTDGARELVVAIDEISKVVTDNAAATEEVSAASEQQAASMEDMAHSAQALSALAENLLDVVKRFQVGTERG